MCVCVCVCVCVLCVCVCVCVCCYVTYILCGGGGGRGSRRNEDGIMKGFDGFLEKDVFVLSINDLIYFWLGGYDYIK